MSKPMNIMLPSKIANHTCKQQAKEIERLHSIIEEVREYIVKHNETIRNRKELGVYGDFMIIPNELLEILDKENSNE